MSEDELVSALTYAGFIFTAFELVKRLIVGPVKSFYDGVTFIDGCPFRSYEEDVLSRHKNQFEACLLYLRDFMQAIDADDLMAIQSLREHRNELAHKLPELLENFDLAEYVPLLERANKALFKLSNYRTYMDLGADPKFKAMDIDWDSVYGQEYMLFSEIVKKVKMFSLLNNHGA